MGDEAREAEIHFEDFDEESNFVLKSLKRGVSEFLGGGGKSGHWNFGSYLGFG